MSGCDANEHPARIAPAVEKETTPASVAEPAGRSEAVSVLCDEMEFAAGLSLAMTYNEDASNEDASLASVEKFASQTTAYLAGVEMFECDREQLAHHYGEMRRAQKANFKDHFRKYLEQKGDLSAEEIQKELDALP
jgi:hypothetical protein